MLAGDKVVVLYGFAEIGPQIHDLLYYRYFLFVHNLDVNLSNLLSTSLPNSNFKTLQ